MEEAAHTVDGVVGLALLHSEKPGGAEVFVHLWLEEFDRGTAGVLDAEVVGEMGDEAGEELKFFVGGSLFLGRFECAEGRAKTRGHLVLWDGKTPGCFVGAGVLIDWEKVGVCLLDWAVLWEFGAIDLADL